VVIWIEKALALTIHNRQLAEHGGRSGVRDEMQLASALARPQQLQACGDPPPDMAALAASLAYGLARNHPFIDGNKRTAAVACETFIELNGLVLSATDLELFPVYLALAMGKLSEDDLAAWLRPRLAPHAPRGVHKKRGRYTVKRRTRRPAARSMQRSNPT